MMKLGGEEILLLDRAVCTILGSVLYHQRPFGSHFTLKMEAVRI
jgi:hypothetical protein